ncbi:hypothetical protein D3C80_883620 [compost metagenome]
MLTVSRGSSGGKPFIAASITLSVSDSATSIEIFFQSFSSSSFKKSRSKNLAPIINPFTFLIFGPKPWNIGNNHGAETILGKTP